MSTMSKKNDTALFSMLAVSVSNNILGVHAHMTAYFQCLHYRSTLPSEYLQKKLDIQKVRTICVSCTTTALGTAQQKRSDFPTGRELEVLTFN